MAKTLLTGATGFIGSHLARRLAERGDDLRVTVREGSDTLAIDDLDVERVRCDILDRRAVRRALKGVGRVFHAAGMTSMRPQDRERLFEVNVGGARTVLGECLRADVARVVFTSNAAALGPAARGQTADEAQLFTAGHLGIPYVNSVHEAEVEAIRLAAKGLPLVCVNPSVAFGPGDTHVTSTRLVRSFLLGRVPAYADGGLNVVDVRDVASGHLLADQHGTVGERYILGGRNFTFERLFADLGRISGVEPPLRVPRGIAAVAASVLHIGPGHTTLSPGEVLAASQFWTYRSTKAKRDLGWKARAHEETLEATVSWYQERERERIVRGRRSQQLQYRVAGAAISVGEGMAGAAGRVLRGLGGL
ncbi:MAG: NAD-dependent epimerase/dehydratase family protein [Thermoleophilaceae bacterium]|nr:NAD-dependent epimerase/dehydratase family protein [Thermoleophilaceae bacterium]